MAKDRELEELWYSNVEEDFTGREIEVKRKVDLASYNDYETIAKSTDWVDWTDSENLEFDFLARRILKVYADRFILQATEYGLSRYEKLLKIEPGKNESLEERRKRVYLLWNKKVIWTHRTLLKWLDIAIGKENYDVELFYDEYAIEFKILMYNQPTVDQGWLRNQLRRIIPANLGIKWTLVYNQKIYYGLTEQKTTHVKIYPSTAEDRVSDNRIFFGIDINNKKVSVKDKPVEVWTTDNNGFLTEIVGEGGEKLSYDRG